MKCVSSDYANPITNPKTLTTLTLTLTDPHGLIKKFLRNSKPENFNASKHAMY